MGWFRFLFTPANRGVGVANLAVEKTQSDPIQSIYGPRYNVQRSMIVTGPANVKFQQSVPIVPIEGNGSFLQGQMALQSLMDLEKAKAA
jgi:hypothetical protein